MSQDEEGARESWARTTAHHLVDGALAASERSARTHPSPDQIALLREIARRALSHLPNSDDELKNLRDFLAAENLRRPLPGDDEPPWP
jgi:hypothetical protein